MLRKATIHHDLPARGHALLLKFQTWYVIQAVSRQDYPQNEKTSYVDQEAPRYGTDMNSE